MSFISASYSVKKLSDKRFTSENTLLTTEAFTSPIDINANEVYTDFRYIPTSSAGLEFSGSSQHLKIVSASATDPTITTEDDVAVLKYWYRKKLKRGNQGGRSTWFFVEDDSFGSNDAVFSDQLITSSQQTNFISPKYIIADNSNNTTEGVNPGYKVQVSVGTNAASATIVNNLTYVFDYKTGILSFLPGQTPANVSNTSNYVFVSAYQYVGRTLSSQIVDGTLGGTTGDIVNLHFSASEGGGFSIANLVTSSFESGSAGITVTATPASNKITIGDSSDDVTFNTVKISSNPINSTSTRPLLGYRGDDSSIRQFTNTNSGSGIYGSLDNLGTSTTLLISGSTTTALTVADNSTTVNFYTFGGKGALFAQTKPNAGITSLLIGNNSNDYVLNLGAAADRNDNTLSISGSLFLRPAATGVTGIGTGSYNSFLTYNNTTGEVHFETGVTSSVSAVTNDDTTNIAYGIVFAHTGSGVNLHTDAERGAASSYGLTYNPSLNRLYVGSAANATIYLYEDGIQASTGGSGNAIDLFTTDASLNNITLGHSNTLVTIQGDTTVNGNTILKGNLTVQGTTTTIDTENLVVEDKFIFLNSSSTAPVGEGGIIVRTNTGGSGSALFYDGELNRWMVSKPDSVTSTITGIDTSITASYDVGIIQVGSNLTSETITSNFGDVGNPMYGSMFIDDITGDIYILSTI